LMAGGMLVRWSSGLVLGARDDDELEGRRWREFGLRTALERLPRNSPARGVLRAVLDHGTLTPEEARRFKSRGLRIALANMPPEAPGRAVLEDLLARETGRRSLDPHGVGLGVGLGDNEPERGENPLSVGLASELERLVALRDQGHLTPSEFAAAKRKLLR
jgi:Short C-terminal domain